MYCCQESCGHNGWKGNFQGLWNPSVERWAGSDSLRSGRGSRLPFLERGPSQGAQSHPLVGVGGEGLVFFLREKAHSFARLWRSSYWFRERGHRYQTPGSNPDPSLY